MHVSFLWEEGPQSTHQSYQLSTLGCYKIHSSVVLYRFRMNLILSITFFFQWSNVLCKLRIQWRDFTSMVALCNLSDWPDVWHPTPALLPGKSHGQRTLQSMGSLRVGHDWATSLSLFIFMHWRRKWQPTPVFLPGESQGWGSLVGCRLWGHTESDTTEAT